MDKLKFTIAAIALHISLGGLLFAATTPEDELLKRASYETQNAQIDIYKTMADAAINGKTCQITGATKPDGFGGWYIVDGPTGNVIWLHEDGSATVTVDGEERTFLPE